MWCGVLAKVAVSMRTVRWGLVSDGKVSRVVSWDRSFSQNTHAHIISTKVLYILHD